jgi:hypothetical protein
MTGALPTKIDGRLTDNKLSGFSIGCPSFLRVTGVISMPSCCWKIGLSNSGGLAVVRFERQRVGYAAFGTLGRQVFMTRKEVMAIGC